MFLTLLLRSRTSTQSVHAWRARLNGRPYSNGIEFRMQQIWDKAVINVKGGEEVPNGEYRDND